MRKINEIILHCTATKEGKDFKAKDIRNWHIKGNGWRDIGYHYVIDLDGKVEDGRPISQVGAHCKGHNANSIGIVYVGGIDENGKAKDTRTQQQRESMYALVHQLLTYYQLSLKDVHCHNEYSSKACPSFTIEQFRKGYTKWLDDYYKLKEKEKENE